MSGARARFGAALCLVGLACAGVRDPGTAPEGPTAPQGPSHVGPVSGLAVAGDRVYSCSQSGILIEQSGQRRPLLDPGFRVFDLDAREVGERGLLLAGGGDPARRGAVALFDLDGAPLAQADVGEDLVYAVAISQDGARAAVACADGRICELDLPRLDGLRELQRHSAPSRSVAYWGDVLASGGLDGNVVVYDGSRKPTVIPAHTAGVECVAFTADGTLIMSGARDGKVRLHAFDGRLHRIYQRLGDRVTALCATPSGALLAGLRDGALLRLQAEGAAFEEVARFDAPIHALAPRGGAVLVGLQSEWKTVALEPAAGRG